MPLVGQKRLTISVKPDFTPFGEFQDFTHSSIYRLPNVSYDYVYILITGLFA